MSNKVLAGRTALITGTGRGIGRVVCRRLAEAGARVMLSDLNEQGADVAEELVRDGFEAAFIAADLSSRDDLAKMVESCADTFGALDILVNNARPRLSYEPFPASMESWDLAMNVLLKAPAQTIELALPHLEKSTGASVINISSTNAFLISQQPVTYHVTKAAILQLSKHLAYELGPKGIRVNSVCPGLVDLDDRAKKLTDDPAHKKVVENIVPLGRASNAAEIGDMVVYLASDAAAYVTGQSFVIDGGVSLGDQFACSMRVVDAFDAR